MLQRTPNTDKKINFHWQKKKWDSKHCWIMQTTKLKYLSFMQPKPIPFIIHYFYEIHWTFEPNSKLSILLNSNYAYISILYPWIPVTIDANFSISITNNYSIFLIHRYAVYKDQGRKWENVNEFNVQGNIKKRNRKCSQRSKYIASFFPIELNQKIYNWSVHYSCYRCCHGRWRVPEQYWEPAKIHWP